jgi:hypothetical protein
MRASIIWIRRRRGGLCFLCHGADRLPLAQRGPDAALGRVGDRHITDWDAALLGLIDNAIIQGHGLWGGFVNTGILKPAFGEDGNGRELGLYVARAVRGQLKQSCGAQSVGLALLCLRQCQTGAGDQEQSKAGLKGPSAI